MSLTTIEQHHAKWSDLPLFTHERWVVTDEDVQAWGDLIYMRTLVDDIIATGLSTGQIPTAPGGQIEFDTEQYLEPWPTHDPAEELLKAWRFEAAVDAALAAAVPA